jgi:excisionase family DNA binding protein
MEMNGISQGLWGKQQAADYLGVAVSTLNHWICDRKVVFVKLGRLVKFRQNDLDRFIARNVHGKQPSQPDPS